MTKFSDPAGLFSFQYPQDWTVEPLQGGVLLLAPEPEFGWQANLFFELLDDPLSRGLEQAMSDLLPELRKRKAGFELQSMSLTTVGGGLEAGQIEYRHRDGETDLLDWEVLVPVGDRAVLFVTASTAAAGCGEYQPIFTRVLDSLELR